MQNCITSAILLSFLLIFGVRPSAAQTRAPSIYNAYTGTDVKVVPPPPALGPANSVITDPTFGSRVLRVTDANTKGGESFISTDSGFSRAWNANSTAIKLTGPFGDGYWMEFNPSTFQAGTGSGEPVLHPVSFGATWEWSAVQPNIIYYLSGSTIETYNTTSGASTPVASTPTGDPVAYTAAVIGLDNWVCAAVGAGPQDTYTKIFCVSPSNPSIYKFIDVVNKTINGAVQSSPNWPTSAAGETIGIHDISGGTGPNWLEVTFHQQSWGGNGGAVFDLSTNTWSLVTNADPYWSGHVSMGNGRYENSSGSINGNDSRGTVLRDPDNLMNSSEYLFVMQPFAPWNSWCDADHSSWLNSLTNPNAPILDSRYSASTACQFAWSDEIVAAAVDGSNTVWRFAHNFNGGSLCYYAQAFAQISNDGNWALFSSYWGGTLGPDKSFGCATRIDTFIVDLKDSGLPTANSVSPNSGAGASRVFTFQYSSVNGSGYLSIVYALINGSFSAANGCYVYYVPASNALYLYNDAGSAVAGPLTPGSGGTLSNSQCTLNGSGSSATGSGNTLALALSISFKAAFAGQQNVYGYAADNGGNASGWQTLGTWNSSTPVNTPPTADSVSPSSGTGSSQVFTFRYSSVNGYGYLSIVYALINGSFSAANGCYVYYVPASNALYLYNDAGSAVAGPLTPGSGGTLSNSQCTLNGGGSAVTGSGNTLALALSISFKAAFAGQQNVYGYAADNGGNASGWQTLGTWNSSTPVNTPPTADSVSPSSGTGSSQVFTFRYSSVNGYGYLSIVYALINGSFSAANGCYVYYVPASNALYLYNDAGSAVAGPLTPGSGGTLSNSQCTLNGSGSSATGSGNPLALALSIGFKAAFAGQQNVYGYAADNGGNASGWQTLGTWNSTPVNTPPTADSVSPSSGTGSSQVFTFRYSSVNGNGYLSIVYALINGSFSAANGCYVYYVPASNALYLYNDAGSAVAGPLTPGSGGTLSNSQCTLNGSGSAVTGSGNTLALALSISFKAAFAGQQNVYGYAADNGGNASGWQTLGTWNSSTPVNTPPTADSVSPSSGTGSSQVFTFRYSSVNGYGYLSIVYALINGSFSAANGCYVYYVPASNALYLYNDAGSAVAGPLTPGSGGTLSNSQCTLNGSGSSATGSGNTLALALSISFKAAFAGQQNVYGYAADNGGNASGWQTLGTWNSSTPVNTPPTADSVSPSSGTGSSQVFTFRYSSVNGYGYLSIVYALINGSFSAANGCYVYYVPASNALYLYNDAGSAVAGPLTPGSGGTLSNSQCTLNGSGSAVTGSGNTLALALSISFKAAFAGQQNVYGYAADNGGNASGWQTLGTWNSSTPVNTPPTADSVSPSSGTGSSQVFTFRYSSVNGYGYLSIVYALINGSFSAANGCYVYYVPASNALYLYNDAGSAVAGPLTPGSGGTLSNSQCTLNGSGSAVTGSGNTLALALSISFKAAFAGQQNVYGYAADNGGNASGWQTLGTWNSSTPVNTPPTADSVSPSSGTGSSQVFTFRYSSVNGYGYLSIVYALINGSFSAANGCYVYYVPASNALYLYNDAGSAVAGPLTPGSGGTLSNSQCTLNGSGSSVTGSGNTLALALSISFKAAFAGLQNLYGYALDSGGNISGWQLLGTWTQAAGLGAITVSTVTVGQGLQVPMMITFNPAPTYGVTDPVHGCDNPTTPGCLTVSSSNAAVMIQGHGGSSTQVVVPVAAGTTSLSLLVQAVGSPGATSTMTASAAGYTNGTGTTTIANSGFVLSGPNSIGGAFPTFQGVSTTLTVYAARLDANNLFVEPEEVMANVTVPIAVVPNTIGTVSPTSLGFIAGTSSMTATFQASGVNTGGATVMLTQPSQPFQFTTPATGGSLNITVSRSGYVAPTLTIGQNLEVPANVSITGNAPSATTITLTSSDSTRLQFACLSAVEITKGGCSNGPAGTTTPTASGTITVSLPQNQNQSASFNAIGSGAPGSVSYTISGGNFGMLQATATVVPSELMVQTNSAALGESPEVTVSTAAVIGGAPVIEEVALNQAVTVTVTSSPPNVGSITNPTVSIAGGSSSGTTFFQPAALGQATITASANGFSSGTTQLTVTNGSTLQISNGASVGQFLENQNRITLGQPAPSGGLPVTLSVASGSIGLMQLAVNPTDPGSNSIVVTVPAGQHSASYYVYALQPSGTATYSATAPGFGSASDTVTLAPSGIDIFETTPQGSPTCAINCNVSLAAGPQTFSVLVNQLSTDGNNTIVEQQNLAGPTGSSAAATTGTASSGSTALIVASGTGLTTGQLVIGPGIAPGTFLVSGGGTSWVLSQATISALSSTSLAFYNAGLSVTVNDSNQGAGTLSSGAAIVTPGTGFGSLTFTPVASGSTTLSVTQPNGFLSPGGFPGSELTQVAVTVGP